MPRFYLTTAIDYVNSRPHLGTAYEKITADVIARFKRLSGVDTHFVMGNDEHSQNVFRRARDLGKDPLAYCDGMEQEFREVWARARPVVRRLHPDHAAAPQGGRRDDRQPHRGGRRPVPGRLRGLVLRRLRGLQAGEGPRRRALPDPPHEAGLDQGAEPLLQAVGVSRSPAGALRRASRSSCSPKYAATRSCACSRRASTTSRSAGPGSRGAFRCRPIRPASSTSGSMR